MTARRLRAFRDSMALVTAGGSERHHGRRSAQDNFGDPIGTIEGAPEAEVRRPGPDGSVRGGGQTDARSRESCSAQPGGSLLILRWCWLPFR